MLPLHEFGENRRLWLPAFRCLEVFASEGFNFNFTPMAEVLAASRAAKSGDDPS